MKIAKKLYFVITPTETMPFTTRLEARNWARETNGILVESMPLGGVTRARLQNIAELSGV